MALKSVSSSPAPSTGATSSSRGSGGGIPAMLGGGASNAGSGTTPGTAAPGSSGAAMAPQTPAASSGTTRSNAGGASNRAGSNSAGSGAGGPGRTGAAGGSNGTAAPANTASSNGSTATPAAGGGEPNFLQLLAQSSAGAKADPKAASAAPAKSPDAKPPTDDTKTPDDSSNTDPTAIAAAIALLSQYMASPPASAANPAPPAPTASDTPQANAAAASLNGVTAAANAPAGTAGSATDAKGKTAAATTTEQDLAALLVGDADEDLTKTTTTSADSTQSGGSSSQNSSSTPDDGGGSAATSAAALLNPQASMGAHLAAPPVPTHHADLKSPVGTSAWTDELGGKVTWMAKQGIESASLKLSPEHLGPVEVQISVQNGSASVMFGAAQADTRTALEQALPRLHEMFAGQGLTLADAGVSREPPRQQARPSAVAPISGISAVSDEAAPLSTVMRVRLGLLDTYA